MAFQSAVGNAKQTTWGLHKVECQSTGGGGVLKLFDAWGCQLALSVRGTKTSGQLYSITIIV
jgi:hypothetical protein